MYNVKEVDQLDVVNRWRQNETYKTMAVPLGVRGKDDILSLNLHEKAHGLWFSCWYHWFREI